MHERGSWRRRGTRAKLNDRKQQEQRSCTLPEAAEAASLLRRSQRREGLQQASSGVFAVSSKATLTNLAKAESHVMYGYPSLKTVRDLVHKRGFARVNRERVPITDNKLVEDELEKPFFNAGMTDVQVKLAALRLEVVGLRRASASAAGGLKPRQTARGGAVNSRGTAGDVWRLSRLAHGREEQCARNNAQPVYRPPSSPARRAGEEEGRCVKAQVHSKSLRARGRLGACV